MRRREVIGSLAVAVAGTWPGAGGAQPALPTIGFLGTTSASAWKEWTAGFVQRLGELGWLEGRTVLIEYRWGEGRGERFAEIAAELVGRKVDVIVTSGGAGVAAKQATSTIPIVFALANDPVGGGLVTSLARPGGNVTGLSLQGPDLAGKRVELLREVLPSVRRLAILANVGYPASVLEMNEVSTTARASGLAVMRLEIKRREEIAAALGSVGDGADALYVCTDPLMNTSRAVISASALAARLPTMHSEKQYVEAGGLVSYGPDVFDLFRRAAEYVDKILRGARPGDLPIAQPTKFELVVNLHAAKALGVAIPPAVLTRADEVIE
jgi:putative ABC transport system substrate-binding protein